MKKFVLLSIKRSLLIGVLLLFAGKLFAYTAPTALRILWPGTDQTATCHDYGDYITNVTFAGINNTTAGSGPKAWHSDFGRSPQIAAGEVTIGQTYSFSVTLTASDYTYDYVAVYVDWNQNNVNGTTGSTTTLDINENPLVWTGLAPGSGSRTLTGNITVPTGISTGQIYMRVMIDCDSNNPAQGDFTCAVGLGEFQDYVLNVSAASVAPTVTGISPTSGPTSGGTSVTITGTNLSGATAVKFGTNNASITSNTATQITATAPAGSAGTVDVTVTTAGGTSATSSNDRFTYSVTTGIDDAKLDGVTIYPNPATNSFYLKGIEEGNLTIYDLNGRSILSAVINGNKPIDISALRQGVYTVKIETRNGVTEKKLMKK